ncbi:MAG TPA: DUF2933 domain-containing protein [Nitrospiria bacterium]
MQNKHGPQGKNWLGQPANLGLLGFLAIVGFLLLSEHWAHFFGILPYLLLLACPFIHLFMHRKHGAQDHHHEVEGEKK